MTQPNIIVTRNDLERLEELLSSAAAKGLPGVDSLWQELERAEVVSAKDVPPGVVTMNSTVQFVEEGTGKTHEMTLVYPHEIDGTPGKVSILAPVGSALLGLSEGQTIEWSRPGGGTIKLRVVRVLYQPEASASSAQASGLGGFPASRPSPAPFPQAVVPNPTVARAPASLPGAVTRQGAALISDACPASPRHGRAGHDRRPGEKRAPCQQVLTSTSPYTSSPRWARAA